MNVSILFLIACVAICGVFGFATWCAVRVAATADASPAGGTDEGGGA